MIGFLLMFGGLAVATAMLIRVRHMEEEENTSSVSLTAASFPSRGSQGKEEEENG